MDYDCQLVGPNQHFYGTGPCATEGDFHGSIRSTGGVVIAGNLTGTVDTAEKVIVKGDLIGTVKNTGGGKVMGDLLGTFDTTGEVKVYGKIGPDALVIGGRAVQMRKVKRTVVEHYSVPATREVEREFWEPIVPD